VGVETVSKPHFVGIGGPLIEPYPVRAYSRVPAEIKMEDVWRICGPTVEMNIKANPLWRVFAVVYLEGLMHGAAVRDKERS
jgi:hypothetical protein